MSEDEIALIVSRLQIDAMEQVTKLGGAFNPVTKMWMNTCMVAGVVDLLKRSADPDSICVKAVRAELPLDSMGRFTIDYHFSANAPVVS